MQLHVTSMALASDNSAGGSGKATMATSLESLQIPVATLLEALRRALLKVEFIA